MVPERRLFGGVITRASLFATLVDCTLNFTGWTGHWRCARTVSRLERGNLRRRRNLTPGLRISANMKLLLLPRLRHLAVRNYIHFCKLDITIHKIKKMDYLFIMCFCGLFRNQKSAASNRSFQVEHIDLDFVGATDLPWSHIVVDNRKCPDGQNRAAQLRRCRRTVLHVLLPAPSSTRHPHERTPTTDILRCPRSSLSSPAPRNCGGQTPRLVLKVNRQSFELIPNLFLLYFCF